MPPFDEAISSTASDLGSIDAHCRSGPDIDTILDAIHGDVVDNESWCASVVAAAVDAFHAREARLEVFSRRLETPIAADTSSTHLRLVGHPDTESTVVLSLTRARLRPCGAHQKRLLADVTMHLETGVRLRCHAERIRGLLSADGELLDGHVPLTPSRLWLDLVEGRATLARLQRSAPFYAVVESPPSWHRQRALSSLEERIVTLAAPGVTGKELGYTVGVAASSVARSLRSAASKVGLRTTCELVRIAAGLAIAAPTSLDGSALTATERDVVDLVRGGLTNREIAELRGRSMRTIANQVASVLRKTACPSRRALAAARLRAR